jgi:hypothetical protein
MIPYYIFFLFFGFAASLDYLKQDDHLLQTLKGVAAFTGFLFIILFVGFRYKLGSDWVSYLRFYEDAKPLSQLFNGNNLAFSSDFIEPGFKIFVSLCKDIGLNYAFFVFIITLFNTCSLFYFLYKNEIRNKLVFLALVLILTVFYEFDILRQSIALHIILFSFVGRKIKLLRLITCTLIAMTFHYTAIIFLLFYLFQKNTFKPNAIIFISFVYFISLFVSLPIITSVLKILEPLVGGGALASILFKAVTLIEGFGFQRNISLTSLLNLTFLILLVNQVNKIKLSSAENILIKMFLFYIIINILFKEIQEVADRFSYYFNVGIAFMFCLLDQLIRIKERKMILLTVPLLFIVMRLFIHFKDPGIWYGQTPYRNYFFIDESDEPVIKKRYDMMQTIKSNEYDGKKD